MMLGTGQMNISNIVNTSVEQSGETPPEII